VDKFFKTNISQENISNEIDKNSFYKTRTIGKTQTNLSLLRTNTSFFENSIIKTMVDKIKNEVLFILDFTTHHN
jgi:hypothetical protein